MLSYKYYFISYSYSACAAARKIFDVLSKLVTKPNQQPASANQPPPTQPTSVLSDSPSCSPPTQSPHPQLYSSQPVQQVTYSKPKPQQLPVQSPLLRPVKPFYQAPLPQRVQLPSHSQPASSFPQSPPLWSPETAQQSHIQPQQAQWYTGSSTEEEPALDEVIILDSTSSKTQPTSQKPKPWTDEWDWTDYNFDSDYHTSQSMDRYGAPVSHWHPKPYTGESSYTRGNTDTVISSSRNATTSQHVLPPTPPPINIPPIPFSTPPKLKSVEQVLRENTGTDILSLRKLATALAREAIFGRKEMTSKSLSGRYATGELDRRKIDYIKSIVHSRVPKKSDVEFEAIWKQCHGSLSKSCQTLRNSEKKKATI